MKKYLFRFSVAVLGLAAFFSFTGCNSGPKKRDYEMTAARFFIETSEGDAFASATLPISEVRISLNNKPIVTEFDIVQVEAVKSEMGQLLVFHLTGDAARDLYRFTGDNQGRRLVLAINNRPLGARMIDRPFGAGTIAIYAEVPDAELPALVKNLNRTSDDLQKEIAKQKS